MKKIVYVLSLLFAVVLLSCDYDDSNDIDILKPTDSTATGLTAADLTN
jgi:hypothetical protein